MKRVILTTTSLVFAGGMASADVSLSGSAEMGISGEKGKDAKLHKDLEVKMALSAETDTALSFGGSIDLDEAASKQASATVFVSGAFGTLTLGDTDGAFDNALLEVGSATAIADDHTSHPGYNSNGGLKGLAGNGGNTLRYDYSLGGITASVSGEFGASDSSNSVIGVGVKWSGDLGGVGIGIGLGYQTGSNTVAAVAAVPAVEDDTLGVTALGTAASPAKQEDQSIIGASLSVDMGNGLSVVANGSRKSEDERVANTTATITHAGIGVAYSVGDLTIGVNSGSNTTKGAEPNKASGAGFAAVYSLGTGASFQVGVGAGKDGNTKESSWSAGLAFSF